MAPHTPLTLLILLTNIFATPRLVKSCTSKCIDTSYREADLNKGESVCLDRCVSKFFEVNVKVSEKMQGEAQGKQGGGMFGA
jgi:import inner membrane translocase subunit TIM10